MFSRKTVIILGVILAIALNIVVLSVTSRRYPSTGPGRLAIALIAPFQDAVSGTIRSVQLIWSRYFYLATVSQENERLSGALGRATDKLNRLKEIELSNERLRDLLHFQKQVNQQVLAAEVIGKNPSPWFRTVLIDKGSVDGVVKGLPVVVPEGIVGQVVEVSGRYAKVLLVIDQNSAVDALVQRTRARGIVKGQSDESCRFEYVLRKHDIKVGDTVVASGMDGVYPKGLRIGYISELMRRNAGIFQEVRVTPFVDFEKLEELLILLKPRVPAEPQER